MLRKKNSEKMSSVYIQTAITNNRNKCLQYILYIRLSILHQGSTLFHCWWSFENFTIIHRCFKNVNSVGTAYGVKVILLGELPERPQDTGTAIIKFCIKNLFPKLSSNLFKTCTRKKLIHFWLGMEMKNLWCKSPIPKSS